MEVRRFLQDLSHFCSVECTVSLSSGGLNRRPSGSVQEPELNASPVNDFSHDAAESVNLPNNVPFCYPANRRVAGHLTYKIQIDRNKRSLCTQPRGRRCRLAPRVPGSNHDHIKMFVEIHLFLISAQKKGGISRLSGNF
jgi:hypothetical protein